MKFLSFNQPEFIDLSTINFDSEIRELVLSSDQCINDHESNVWTSDGRKKVEKKSIILIEENNLLSFYNRLSDKINLDNLKKLKINFIIDLGEFDIHNLNSISHLEHLELKGVHGCNNTNEENRLLVLPELKIISIYSLPCCLLVVLPKLKTVFSTPQSVNNLVFKENPITVTNLILDTFASFERENEIKFSNLEYLKLKFGGELDPNFLSRLPVLKELDFEFKTRFRGAPKRNFIAQLCNQKIELKRDDLKLFYKGKLVVPGSKNDKADSGCTCCQDDLLDYSFNTHHHHFNHQSTFVHFHGNDLNHSIGDHSCSWLDWICCCFGHCDDFHCDCTDCHCDCDGCHCECDECNCECDNCDCND